MFRLDEYEDPRQRQKESGKTPRISEVSVILPVLWIQMRMHPELLPTSGFGIIVQIQQNMKEQINNNVISL